MLSFAFRAPPGKDDGGVISADMVHGLVLRAPMKIIGLGDLCVKTALFQETEYTYKSVVCKSEAMVILTEKVAYPIKL